MMFEFLNEVAAAPVRTPHPEDSIFDGAASAGTMLQALDWIVKNPGATTIKWDGMPALVFGRRPDGKFILTDKYMFDKPNGRVTSPEGWAEYDRARGANRGDLYQRIANIWSGLEQAVGSTPGFFWGDLMWSQPLTPQQGQYVFKPNVVEYRIPVASDLGRQIRGRSGGVAVHSYLADEQARPVSWNGQGLKLDGPVMILTPTAGVRFELKDPVRVAGAAKKAVASLGAQADKFLAGLDGVARQALKKYANHQITGQTQEQLADWLKNNVSGQQYKKLVGDNYGGYIYREARGLEAVFAIWNAIYAYKQALVNQLESQVQGISQTVAGHAGGEGFVFNTPTGVVKLVPRQLFSRALFNK